MTYEENLRNDIRIAFKLMRDNQTIQSESIDFMFEAVMEKVTGESISRIEFKNTERVLDVIEMEETLPFKNLQDKAMVLSHDLEKSLTILVRMNKVEINEGIVSIIK